MSNTDPVERLNAIIGRYPETGTAVESFMQGRGKDLPDWPRWCFLPVAGWHSIVTNHYGRDRLTPELAQDLAELAALGTWRYTQGVYRFDPAMQQALVASPIKGDLPARVLLRLPEWCVYVETPGLTWLGEELHGFWAYLESDANDGRSELRLLLNTRGLVSVIAHIGHWSLEEAVSRFLAEAQRQAGKAGAKVGVDAGIAGQLAEQINPIISLLLYLCSDEPEIDDAREPGSSPPRPRMKKTRKGMRLFPAERVRFWDVGKATGEALREAATRHAQPGLPTGRSVRPHVRHGHWHGYWRGPRDGERYFIYRWISPLLVRGSATPE